MHSLDDYLLQHGTVHVDAMCRFRRGTGRADETTELCETGLGRGIETHFIPVSPHAYERHCAH